MPKWSSSIASTSGWPASTAASSRARRGVEHGAGRVLRARGDHDRRGAGAQRLLRAPRAPSRARRGDGLQAQPVGAQQVVQGRVAGVLDGHAVARAQVRRQRELDPVERAADDAQLAVRQAAAELLARELAELGQHRRLAVEVDGEAAARERGGDVGKQRGVGVAAGEVARARRDRQRRRARRRRERASPRACRGARR